MRRFDPAGGVLIVLHGFGDDPASARSWGRRMAPHGWEIIAPGAPSGDGAERSWFSTGPRGVDATEIATSARRVGDLIDRVHETGRRVAVAGFSQGGALALALPVFDVQPDATVAMCAFMPELGDGMAAHGGSAGPSGDGRVLILSAGDDEDVPAFMGDDAAALLAAAGRQVHAETMDGGHRVSDEMAARARSWLGAEFVPGLRISMGLPVERVHAGAELVSGRAIGELAAAYEQLGYHAAYVTDHPAPDDRWLNAGGHHALEPTVALTAAAMTTRRLLLHTNVYVLPYRNPFLAAKALASVDVISDGRLIVGVAAGYLRPEFEALGADFDGRGARLDEALAILPRVWTESALEAEGPGWGSRAVTALPRPVQHPGPPIWVGGNSNAALRRAVAGAQGWTPFPTPEGMAKGLRTAAITDMATLRRRLDQAAELCEASGRTEPLTICFVPFSLAGYLADPAHGAAPLVEEIAELADLGVDWTALMVPGNTRSEIIDAASGLADALGLDRTPS